MSQEGNAGVANRQRAANLRRLAIEENDPGVRYQMFEIAAEYDRLAFLAEAFEARQRYERCISTANILPFRPRA